MSKNIVVYRGVDNFIDIIVNDQEQQPVAVNSYEFELRVRDSEFNTILDKTLGFVDGFRNRLALDLTIAELQDLELGTYTYAIAMTDTDGYTRPLFLELNGEANAKFQVIDSPIR